MSNEADDKERDQALREMARHRGFRLVKSRRRKPGADRGKFGLVAATDGAECLGFGKTGLTASAEEIEAFLRGRTHSTWKQSLSDAGARKGRKTPHGRSKSGAVEASPPRKNRNRHAASDRNEATVPKTKRAPVDKPKAEAKNASPPPLRIREADTVDSEAMARLVSNFAPASADEIAARLAILAHAGVRPLVARLGDEVVGLVTWHVTFVLHRPAPVGRITFLQVDEAHRRCGIGRRLVEAVEQRLRAGGCGAIEVTSHVKLTRAHAFYRALGFQRTSYRFGKSLENEKKRKKA